MGIFLIQTLILGALTLLSGYGFLGFYCYFFQTNSSSFKLNFSPAIVFILGLIPFALTYSFLGVMSNLNSQLFIVITLFFGVFGSYLFGLQLIVDSLKPARYLPDLTSVFLIIILFPVLIYVFSIASLPTSNWDAISYVLSFPKIHISEGSVRYLSEYGIFSAFPIYGEAIVGLPLLVFKSEQVVQIYISLFFINLLFISRHIFKCFTSSRLYLFLSQITIGYLPIILINVGIAKVEMPQAAIVLASILLLNIGESKHRKCLKLLSILLFVFGIGVKYTTIFYLPIFIFSYLATEKNKNAKIIVADGIRFIMAGIAINIIWIYTNIVEHCNPLFPNLIKYLGSCRYSVSTMTDIMTMVNESTFLQKGTSLEATHSISKYFPFFVEAAGTINTALIIFAVFIFIAFQSKKVIKSRLSFLYYGVAASFSIHIFLLLWEFRYFLVVLTLTIVIIFILFSYILKNRIFGVIISGAVFLQLYFSITAFHARNSYIFLPLTNQISFEKYRENWVHLYWVAKFINENTAPDSVVAFNWGVQPFFYLNRKYFFLHDWNPEGATQEMKSSSELLNLLQQKKCNYLVWRNQDESRFKDPSLSKLYHARMNGFLDELVKDGVVVVILTRDDVTIYSVLKK